MTRGTVVTRGGRIGVVWSATPTHLALLPVRPGTPIVASDVAATELSDRITLGDLRGVIVRAGIRIVTDASEQRAVGRLSDAMVAALEAASARFEQERAVARRWEAERRHRARAVDERSVV